MTQEYLRFMVDLAIPKVDWDGFNSGQKNKIKNDLLDIKTKSKKIKEGEPNEEDTVRVKWHICRHEIDNTPCAEQDVTEDYPE